MQVEGTLAKMHTAQADIVKYKLPIGDTLVDMNPLLGQIITLEYMQHIYCVACGQETAKSFAQGFCYKCLRTSPLTADCIMRPELCQAHEGIARDMDFAQTHCLIDHHVYLAISSALKVGVTRHNQIPTRWIDQGATQAIILATTPDRYTAGVIEVALKESISDRTNWQKMLRNMMPTDIDLLNEKEDAYHLLPEHLQAFVTEDDTIHKFQYPSLQLPDKVKSLNFDKQASITGKLIGIKGQYLIFENNTVLNIRKHGGYHIKLTTNV